MASPAVVGGSCFFQVTAQVPSSTNSKSNNHALKPGLLTGPKSLSPRLSCPLSLSSRHHRRLSATSALTLPTAKPERIPSDNAPRWSARALKSVALAEVRARNFKRYELGTDMLLLGVLADGTSEAANYLRDIGIAVTKVREEIDKGFEVSGRYRFQVTIPLSDSAQRSLDWAVDYKLKSGEDGEITVGHLVLGIWSQKESKGHKFLAALGFDSKKAKELSKMARYDASLNYR